MPQKTLFCLISVHAVRKCDIRVSRSLGDSRAFGATSMIPVLTALSSFQSYRCDEVQH